jgi:hypothetical protein
MLDTVGDPRSVFSGLEVQAVAAYGNGRYANYEKARTEFPHVPILEIDVSGQGIGNAGDFERGDMAYSHAGEWAKRRIQAGVHRPVIYFSVSNWQAIEQSLQSTGLHRSDVRVWTAHYTGKPHLCSVECGFGHNEGDHADATQWASAGTLPPPYEHRDVDVSMTAGDFF